jgi:aminoglycoside phosphotransferase (APT) family kinase protein
MITDKLSSLGFPVAKPLHLCTDSSIIGTPFYVMIFVEGRIFKDVKLPELPPADRLKVY